jgi:TonB family protein
MKRILILLPLLLSASLLAEDKKPHLKSAAMPFYPVLALQARLEGKISLRFVVNEKGETADIEATSGDKLLRDAAIENLQTWKFWPPTCACRSKEEAILVYKLSRDPESAETPDVAVKWFGREGPITVQIEGRVHLMHWQP